MRLIDASNMRGDLKCKNAVKQTVSKKDVLRFISEQPTIDAVPVVRCKNCAYHKKADEAKYAESTVLCSCPDITGDWKYCIPMWENDFCSYGKEKQCTSFTFTTEKPEI